ncbi:hypothetical protein M513_05183 [Trichuris suis]|nr:hypothetical protein M513_05183 [Trichuris suis]
MSKNSPVQWNRRMRQVAEDALAACDFIRGPRCTVEADEALFGKRKSNRGRVLHPQWVLGGVCRETGECFLEPVDDRKTNTLVPLIRRHVLPGSTIITDEWRSYYRLKDYGYTHLRVNHSANFVDKKTKANTQMIESLWNQAKHGHKVRYGTRRSSLASDLREFMWRRKLRRCEDCFAAVLEKVAALSSPQ